MSTSSENLWSTLLRECSKRSRFADAHCIFVGESMCGKSALVDKICHEDQNLIALHSPNEIVGYDYFDVEEGLSDSDLASKINVWSLNENFFENPLETFIQPSKNEKVIFLLGIDLSNPHQSKDKIKRWLQLIKSSSENLFRRLGEAHETQCKSDLLEYIRSIRPNKFGGDDFQVSVNLGLPLIIVGLKADTVKSDDSIAAEQFRGYLRALSLQFGAAFINTSAINGTNCEQLRKYITHRLYPETIPCPVGLQEGSESCFYPTGFDTPDLIFSSTGMKVADLVVELDISQTISIPQATTTVPATTPGGGSSVGWELLEDEDEWLANLQTYIKQASESASSSSSATTSTSETAQATAGSRSRRPMSTSTSSSSLENILAGGGASAGVAGVSTSSSQDSFSDVKPPAAPAPKSRRQQSVAIQGKDADPDSFFQNLLSSPPAAAKK